MGIARALAPASRAKYESAIKKLFPQGDYWDEQFADPAGDVSLFARAKLDELIRFRRRMSDLQNESRTETTGELIADWERVLLGEVTYGKSLAERRLLLKSREDNKLNRAELQKIADIYGFTILDITFPYRPAFFAHARFNTSFLGGPAVFSVLLIRASEAREKFRTFFTPGHPVQQFGTMRFGLERLAYFPVSRLCYYLNKTLRAASAGFFKTGIQRLFPSPAYKIQPIVENRLQAASAGFIRFGTDRLTYSPVPAMRRIVSRRIRKGSAGCMRMGRDRLFYTSVCQIRKTVHDRLRSFSTGFARCGQNRLLPMPFYRIGKLLEKQFRSVSFGEVKFGLSRLAPYSGGFSHDLVRNEINLFSGWVKVVIQNSGIMPKTGAQMVDAIIGNSRFRPRFDISLVQEFIRQNGLLPKFDEYFIRHLIQKSKFFPRLEKAFVNHAARTQQLFKDFERAVEDKLLANQIPYFDYEGV
jgi:uncharacterized protein YmfQ (DUF2313 family)